jgi:hypothetical protein
MQKQSMKIIYSFGKVLLICSLLLSCKKDPPPSSGPTNYFLPPEVTQYFPAQAGDTLVYRDSISGEYDSLFCIRGGTVTTKVTYDGALMFTEESILHSYRAKHPNYPGLRRYTSSWALYQDGRQEIFMYEGSDPMLRFPVRLGDSLHAGEGLEGYSILRAFYPSYTVDNKTFFDVYHLFRFGVIARRSGACDYYLAKGKGIVAVREYKTNRLWVLQ